MIIKNFKKLSLTPERKKALLILEEGLKALNPDNFFKKNLRVDKDCLYLQKNKISLKAKNIYLIGFGKGSAKISQILARKIRFKEGYVIDVLQRSFEYKKIKFFQGTHPLPSEANLNFTKLVYEKFNQKLTKDDLVFVVVCGGGSALFVYPAKINLKKYIELNQALLKVGADIYEMNSIRKHLDLVKGGGLAKILYPAKIVSLIFSDVPGNDLSVIASAPTVKDRIIKKTAWKIIKKFKLDKLIKFEDLIETPKEDRYFNKVKNILVMSNLTGLLAMKMKAEELGLKAKIVKDNLKGEVKKTAHDLLNKIKKEKRNTLLLFGGETTVKVKGKGKGGRNQELVLWFLSKLKPDDNYLIISLNSDGWDNTEFAGAIGDKLTLEKAKDLNLNFQEFLENNDSFSFFKKVEDGIFTGRLPFNVADLILVYKY